MQIDPFIKRWIIGVFLVNLMIVIFSFFGLWLTFAGTTEQGRYLFPIAIVLFSFGAAFVLGKAQRWGLKKLIPNSKAWSWTTSLGFGAGAVLGLTIIVLMSTDNVWISKYVELLIALLIGTCVGIGQSYALAGKVKRFFTWIPAQSILFGGRLYIDFIVGTAMANFLPLNAIFIFILLILLRVATSAAYGLLSGRVLRSLVITNSHANQ